MKMMLGLTGYSGSGKSTIAHHLVSAGWAEVNMGRLIGEFVAKGEGLDTILSDPWLDEVAYDHLKATVPGFHQKLVTYGQAVRDTFGANIWGTKMDRRITDLRATGRHVVWSNVRTENDYHLLLAHGGQLVRVQRSDARAFSHLDTELDDIEPDLVVDNSGPLANVPGLVTKMLKDLR